MCFLNGSIGNAYCQGLNCGDRISNCVKQKLVKGRSLSLKERGKMMESTQKITGDERKASDPKIVGQGTRTGHSL